VAGVLAEVVESAVDKIVGEPNHLKLYSLSIGLDVLTCPLFEISQLIFVLRFWLSYFLFNYKKNKFKKY